MKQCPGAGQDPRHSSPSSDQRAESDLSTDSSFGINHRGRSQNASATHPPPEDPNAEGSGARSRQKSASIRLSSMNEREPTATCSMISRSLTSRIAGIFRIPNWIYASAGFIKRAGKVKRVESRKDRTETVGPTEISIITHSFS